MNQIFFYECGKSRYDVDAYAFILAAGLTNQTHKSAINTLVVGLKAQGLWTKLNAIYPLVGGTATSHKFNLKDPRDLDAAFRIVFSGNFTHNANGIQGDGNASSSIGNTFLNSSTVLTANNNHLSSYSRTNIAANFGDIGNLTSAASDFALLSRWSDTNTYLDSYNATTNRLTIAAQANSFGMFMINRTSTTVLNGWKNGTKIGTSVTAVASSAPNGNIGISGIMGVGGGASNFSTRNYAFFTIGSGFTDTEALNLYTLVQAYQTTLGRQV